MTRPALSIVKPQPQNTQTYADVGPEAHKCFSQLTGKISRVQTTLSGNFTTLVKYEEAVRLLNEAEVLCRSTKNALRSGL